MADDAIAKIFKALADPTRLDIVRMLVREGTKTSCNMASSCSSLSQPALSHHFGKLVESGILRDSKQGAQKYYEVNYALLESIGIDVRKL